MVELKNIVQDYASERIVDDVSIKYEKPGIYMLLGPSGCGKSTVLRMMGGVRPFGTKTPTTGEVIIDGKPCEGPHDDVIMVFQQYANFPHLTVRENVAFPFQLKLWKNALPAKEREARIDSVIASVGLTDRANSRPAQLSGGQNQRLALATALVLRPRILLMDEPFGALDAQTRAEMQTLLVKLWAEQQCLIVFVTHDITEAMLLGDRITVLSTRPARLAAEIEIVEPRPRRDDWLRSRPAILIEEQIINLLRAEDGRTAGTMRVSV